MTELAPRLPGFSPTESGAFTISLDFELMWGVFDKRSVAGYGRNIQGTRRAIERMLDVFDEFEIAVTWATVGLLLCKDQGEMLERMQAFGLDKARPDVVAYIRNHVGKDVDSDPYHFGADILEGILNTKHQELASHSFSHYGVQEPYASVDGFKADMQSMKQLFSDLDQPLCSHVFARNQMEESYIQVIADNNFKAYRGLPNHRLYKNQLPDQMGLMIRIKRLMDSYLPLANTGVTELEQTSGLLNTVASRFLRPWSSRLAVFQPMQMRRIQAEMSFAANNNGFYHLWWHPHNFGLDTDYQIKELRKLLQYFADLREKKNWQSQNMAALAGCNQPVNVLG